MAPKPSTTSAPRVPDAPTEEAFAAADRRRAEAAKKRLIRAGYVHITIRHTFAPYEADEPLEVVFTGRQSKESVTPYPMTAELPADPEADPLIFSP